MSHTHAAGCENPTSGMSIAGSLFFSSIDQLRKRWSRGRRF
ncbi:MAG: hypothetical protein WCI02_07760 [Planctomycetota bacterium]